LPEATTRVHSSFFINSVSQSSVAMTDGVMPRAAPTLTPSPSLYCSSQSYGGSCILHSHLTSCPLQSLPSGGNLLPERSKL